MYKIPVSNLNCPFYNNKCILKSQAVLPPHKQEHDCKSLLNNCSFFAKEKLKQIKADTKLKIYIQQVSNVYLVKADGLVYPANNLFQVDDPLLNKMTFNQVELKCRDFLKSFVKMGFPYVFEVPQNWKIKQKFFFNAVISVESRLVNEADVASAMKKTLLQADQMGLESLVIIPCDNGTHDISLISLSQLSSIFMICQKHEFKSLKKIFICMEDEESEQSFIEYYNRIFGDKNESKNETNSSSDS